MKTRGVFLLFALWGVHRAVDTHLNFEQEVVLLSLAAMAVLWVTEWIPMGWTSLIPLLIFPLLRVLPFQNVAPQYLDSVIFVFLSGFILAVAMEAWSLPDRLLDLLLSAGKLTETKLLWRLMFLIGFASMWMSNTASFLVFFPMIQGLKGVGSSLKKALLFGGAFAASIGGIATPVGSPPNLIYVSYLKSVGEVPPDFLGWTVRMVPLAALLIGFLGLVLIHYFKISPTKTVSLVEREQPDWSPGQIRVVILAALMVGLWFLRPWLLPQLSDAQVGMVVAMSFFVVRSGEKPGRALLDFHAVKKVPWGILLLFGGGLALSLGIQKVNLMEQVLVHLHALASWPEFLLVFAAVLFCVLMTEFVSNTAMAAIMLPILGGVLSGMEGVTPSLRYALLFACTIAGSLSFMMPMATPVNAMIFTSKEIRIQEMAKLGVILNLGCSLLLSLYFFVIRFFSA